MNTETEQSLSRAYELIEADQLDEARSILKAILDNDKNNADAWWLYAHAVNDSDSARLALSNVQRIDPNYPEAAELLETLQTQIGSDYDVEGEPSFLPPVPATLPGLSSANLDDDDENWDAFGTDSDNLLPIWRRPIFLLAAGLILFLVVAAIVITRPSNQLQQNTAPTTVAVNQSPTELATATLSMIVETPSDIQIQSNETPTDMADPSGEYGGLLRALSDFQVTDNAVSSEVTSLGNTSLVGICTSPGPELRTTLELVINIVAQESTSFVVDEDAIGVRMLDCDTDIMLLAIAVTRDVLTNYTSGDLTEEEFQAHWIPVG